MFIWDEYPEFFRRATPAIWWSALGVPMTALESTVRVAELVALFAKDAQPVHSRVDVSAKLEGFLAECARYGKRVRDRVAREWRLRHGVGARIPYAREGRKCRNDAGGKGDAST
jgi:hypothetical protein